ncbi:hypothetical protein CDIK_0842 [Cucumispora dikerogammari]|nr:hypothetical protein CDIK_0842 [Cucumispora dikerogammari]
MKTLKILVCCSDNDNEHAKISKEINSLLYVLRSEEKMWYRIIVYSIDSSCFNDKYNLEVLKIRSESNKRVEFLSAFQKKIIKSTLLKSRHNSLLLMDIASFQFCFTELFNISFYNFNNIFTLVFQALYQEIIKKTFNCYCFAKQSSRFF